MTASALAAGRDAVRHYRMYIDGAWTDGHGSGRLDVENPANESVFATVPVGSAKDAVAALESARRAQPARAALPPIARAGHVFDLADAVKRERSHLARIVVQEQGKPLNQAEGEIDAVAMFLGLRLHKRVAPGDGALPGLSFGRALGQPSLRRAGRGLPHGLEAIGPRRRGREIRVRRIPAEANHQRPLVLSGGQSRPPLW